jgi:hypothetical protein
VYGPIVDLNWKYIIPPTTPEEQAMCFNQRQLNGNAVSFSGLGVLFILIAGSLIIITNLSLPFVVAFAQKHLRRGTYRRMAWMMDEAWQLQRMAYEGAGQGLWRHEESMVPLTQRGAKLALPHQGVSTEHQYVSLKGPTVLDGC